MSNVRQFPGTKGTVDEDNYKAFIAILVQHDGSIEVTLPEGFTKAELLGLFEMAKLMTMDNL